MISAHLLKTAAVPSEFTSELHKRVMKTESSSPLQKLVGEQLSSVIFVQDYLQLDFDGLTLTFTAWPNVQLGGSALPFGAPRYRDSLCELIAQLVIEVREDEQKIAITFGKGTIEIDLTAPLPGQAIEHLVFEDNIDHRWSWR